MPLDALALALGAAALHALWNLPLTRQQEVPERVQRGGSQRERQRVERHARDRTIGACT